jgi:predicted metal-dependent phosphoesterase TrpH
MTTLRADLHVHSRASRQTGNMRFLKSRDCYSSPEDVYRTAKARGMDLVALTDHDSIEGCLEFLSAHPDAPDFIMGEEVSCRFPDADLEIHLGVYGMTEALHRALQPLRRNVFDVMACLREADVFFALNHLLFFYRGQVPLESYLALLDEVPAVEARNGTMLAAHNDLVTEIAERWPAADGRKPLSMLGGSDAHTLRRVGWTWTEAPGSSRETFIQSLREGRARPGGNHGRAASVARDAYAVIGSYVASLAGFGPRDHAAGHRAFCLAFSLVSVPAQFLPLAIVWRSKRREARIVRAASTAAVAWLERRARVPHAAGAGA